MKAKNILIIGAHYDDAELGAGGTAAKLVGEGKKVYKLTLTDNETDFKQMNIKVKQDESMLSSSKACKILGITEIKNFKTVKCNELKYTKETMQAVEQIIFENDIDTVFIHHKYDVNQDHIAAYQICLTAARHCKNILTYQSNNHICEHQYHPTYFVDISKYIDKKKESLNSYGKEHNRFDRLFETKLEQNHIWGSQNKVEYAEGFHIIKMLED